MNTTGHVNTNTTDLQGYLCASNIARLIVGDGAVASISRSDVSRLDLAQWCLVSVWSLNYWPIGLVSVLELDASSLSRISSEKNECLVSESKHKVASWSRLEMSQGPIRLGLAGKSLDYITDVFRIKF